MIVENTRCSKQNRIDMEKIYPLRFGCEEIIIKEIDVHKICKTIVENHVEHKYGNFTTVVLVINTREPYLQVVRFAHKEWFEMSHKSNYVMILTTPQVEYHILYENEYKNKSKSFKIHILKGLIFEKLIILNISLILREKNIEFYSGR